MQLENTLAWRVYTLTSYLQFLPKQAECPSFGQLECLCYVPQMASPPRDRMQKLSDKLFTADITVTWN